MFGSVFLGDPRQRLIASTSPPTSSFVHGPPHISPEVALQLRIRWLEALLLGVNDADKKTSKPTGIVSASKRDDEDEDEEETEDEEGSDEQSLIRRAEEIQRKLDAVVLKNDDISRFVETCQCILVSW
jgi:hypothetical protein